jgi:hypothetical protein
MPRIVGLLSAISNAASSDEEEDSGTRASSSSHREDDVEEEFPENTRLKTMISKQCADETEEVEPEEEDTEEDLRDFMRPRSSSFRAIAPTFDSHRLHCRTASRRLWRMN